MVFQSIKLLWQNIFPPAPTFLPENYPDLTGKVTIVTGGNSGVGYEVVKLLASKNAKVYIFARNSQAVAEAIVRAKTELKKQNAEIYFIKLDLADLTTIKPAVEKFLLLESRLDLVVHNAGVMIPPDGSKTVQGHELQLGANVIAPFLLQKLLDPILIKTSKTNPAWSSRAVWVTSSAQALAPKNGIEIENLNQGFQSSSYTTYGQSKAAMVIVAKMWYEKQHKGEGANILSVSVDPGMLKTNLQRNMSVFGRSSFFLLAHEPIFGAYSELFGALSPRLSEKQNGSFIVSWGRLSNAREDVVATANSEIGEKFWNFLEDSTASFI